MSPSEIERDLRGRNLSIAGSRYEKDTWTFSENDEIDMVVLESSCRSEKAEIKVNVRTRSSAGVATAFASGIVHLTYERIGNEWILLEIRNESFKINEILVGSPL